MHKTLIHTGEFSVQKERNMPETCKKLLTLAHLARLLLSLQKPYRQVIFHHLKELRLSNYIKLYYM